MIKLSTTKIYQMHPRDFLDKYPQLTYKDLAALVGVTEDSVKQWMSGRRSHGETVERLLARIDQDFEDWRRDQQRRNDSNVYAIWHNRIYLGN